ncbi:Detected protein of unknown function [Hibiscus syriacus]|uniref:Uncharacterized protein n=1 Tax=Hibiscus syriacus TaxID=106335 RepID=A0A6A3CHE6_HIBSY|nr:Detected protein of unknown function [Hibiscus syriacus]
MSTAAFIFTPFPPFWPPAKTTPKLSTDFPLRLSSSSAFRPRQPSPLSTFSTLPGGDGGNGSDENAGDENKREEMIMLVEAGRSKESLPKDLAAGIQAGKVPGSVIERFLVLEKSGIMRWLLQFGGFKERLLADDLS